MAIQPPIDGGEVLTSSVGKAIIFIIYVMLFVAFILHALEFDGFFMWMASEEYELLREYFPEYFLELWSWLYACDLAAISFLTPESLRGYSEILTSPFVEFREIQMTE